MNSPDPTTAPLIEGIVLPLPPRATRAGTVALVVRFESTPCSLGPATGYDAQERAFALNIITTNIPIWDFTNPAAKAIWMPETGITVELFITGVTVEAASTLQKIRQTPKAQP